MPKKQSNFITEPQVFMGTLKVPTTHAYRYLADAMAYIWDMDFIMDTFTT